MPRLLTKLRAAQGGRPVQCFPTCWAHAVPPPRSVLIAVGYERVACYRIARTAGSLPAPGSLRIDLTLHFMCSQHNGQYQRGADALLAVPLTELGQPTGTLRITVQTRVEGAHFTTVGTTLIRLS